MNIISLGIIISIVIIVVLYRVTRLERLRYKRLKTNQKIISSQGQSIEYDFISKNKSKKQNSILSIDQELLTLKCNLSKIEMANRLFLVQVSSWLGDFKFAFQLALTPFNTASFKEVGYDREIQDGMALLEISKQSLEIAANHLNPDHYDLQSIKDEHLRLVFQSLACTYDSDADQYTFELKSDGIKESPTIRISPNSFQLEIKLDINLIPYYTDLIKDQYST